MIIVFILTGVGDDQTRKHALHCYSFSIHKRIQVNAWLKNDLVCSLALFTSKRKKEKKKLENRVSDGKNLGACVTNDSNIVCHLPSPSAPALKNSCVQYWLLTFIITSLSSAQENPLGEIRVYSLKKRIKIKKKKLSSFITTLGISFVGHVASLAC